LLITIGTNLQDSLYWYYTVLMCSIYVIHARVRVRGRAGARA